METSYKERGVEYIKCAKNDIAASRILLLIGQNALAIFHLQQSMEKFAKAFLLLAGQAKPNELYGHNIVKILERVQERNRKSATNQAGKNKIDNPKFSKMLAEKRYEISRAKSDQINEFISDFGETLDKVVERLREDPPQDRQTRDLLLFYNKLTWLCVHTEVHEQTTRYPPREKTDLKPSEYVDGLGIVDSMQDMLNWIEEHVNALLLLVEKDDG
jgi:HEPN domain-containing protein